jgi:hypothetical protein
MKKLLLAITLAAALFATEIKTEVTETNLIWTGSGWIVVTSSGGDGDDPMPPLPPVKI